MITRFAGVHQKKKKIPALSTDLSFTLKFRICLDSFEMQGLFAVLLIEFILSPISQINKSLVVLI